MVRLSRRDWLLLTATAAVYLAFAPARWAVEKRAGCEFIAPDMNFPPDFAAYSQAKACLAGNSGAGLDAYVHWHSLGLDLVFPALLAAAATVLLVRIGNALPRFNSLGGIAKWTGAGLLPAAYALADYAENWQVARWLKSGDDALLPLILTLTTLKFAALAAAALVMATFLLATLKHKGMS